jgi:hypothetical protein
MGDVRALQEQVSKAVNANVHSPVEDAARERRKATFSVHKLAEYVNGSADVIQKR